MKRRIEIARNIVAELLNYLLIASVAYVFIVDVAKRVPPTKELFLLVLFPLFFYGLREGCNKLWLFCGLHIVPVLLFVIFYKGEGIYKGIFFAILVIYLFLSIGKRINSTVRGIEAALPPAAMGVYLALYLLDASQENGANGGLLLQLMICFATGYFVYYFLRQFLSYVDVNARTTENIPIKNVFVSSVGLAMGFTAAAFFLITICANRSLVQKISAGIKKIIRKLLSLIQIGSGEVTIEPEALTMQGGGGMPDLGEPVEPSLFMQILDVVLMVGTLCLILVLVCFGIVAFIRAVKEGFHRKGYVHRIEETEYVDHVERIYQKKQREKSQGLSLRERWKTTISAEERIRRIYKKCILKCIPSWKENKWEEFLDVSTARECCFALYPNAKAEALEFVGLYEKARYGKGLCGQKDVQKMKELAQILHKKA